MTARRRTTPSAGPLAAFDASGALVECNALFCELTGRSEAEVLGQRPPFPWWREEHAQLAHLVFERLLLRMQEGTQLAFPAQIAHRDGRILQLEARACVERRRRQTRVLVIYYEPLEDERPDENTRAIRDALRHLNAEIGRLLGAEPLARPVPKHLRRAADSLTRREREVVSCMLRGCRAAGIAEHLSISSNTARRHIQSIFGKLNVHSHAELVRLLAGTELDSTKS